MFGYSLVNVALVFLALGLLIFVHELGHFLVARRLGVRVEQFCFGFGPMLLSLRRGQTVYVFGRKGNWVRVRVHGAATEGWVAGWLVQVYGAPRPAVAEPRPTPKPAPGDNCPPTGGG